MTRNSDTSNSATLHGATTEQDVVPPTRRRSRTIVGTADAEPMTRRSTLESQSLGLAVVAFLLAGLVTLPVFQLGRVSISGEGSIGQYTAIAGAVVAVLAFIAGRYVTRSPGTRLSALEIADVAALALAHAIIALLTWTLFAVILDRGFIGAEVFPVSTIALAGAAAAVTAYICFHSAVRMDLNLLAIVLAVFLVEGVLASTLTASDPEWWKENLSALGMTNDISALAFNLTLIVAGFIVTTLARAGTQGIPSSNPRGARAVYISLIVIGVFLGLVGVFPVDRFFAIHNTVASGMVVAFGVLVITLPRWIPAIPRAFHLLGWVFLGVIVVLGVFFAVGFYTLTAVELVAGILVFTWIILFLRNAAAITPKTDG